jgi:hypothetical protein
MRLSDRAEKAFEVACGCALLLMPVVLGVALGSVTIGMTAVIYLAAATMYLSLVAIFDNTLEFLLVPIIAECIAIILANSVVLAKTAHIP